MEAKLFPGHDWTRVDPREAGMDPAGLARADAWIEEVIGDRPYRLVVARGGAIVHERYRGIAPDERLAIASAAKSLFSSMLGIAIAEGRIPSADAPVVDYFPEMMDVPEGRGPKTGRYAYPKDRAITFRQLISNTSGYMKPGEEPGTVFNYQTYGMNVLCHAIARAYGCYDIANPVASPGFGELVQEKIGAPIGARLGNAYTNFKLHPEARLEVFGYYAGIQVSGPDMARLGWLWCNRGRWGDVQVVPEAWMVEAVGVNPDVRAHCHEDLWRYGYGFWTNQEGMLFDGWGIIPREAFAALGAGGHAVIVVPPEELVIALAPGPYQIAGRATPELVRLVLRAITES
mgnify:FL=1